MVAAVHGIGQPQHGSQFTCPDTSFSITERIQITADHLCHDLPFCVGQADDLCGHDDVISAGAGITETDKFAAIVKNGCNLNQKPFSRSQSVKFLHGIEDLKSIIFDLLAVTGVAAVTLGHISGCG